MFDIRRPLLSFQSFLNSRRKFRIVKADPASTPPNIILVAGQQNYLLQLISGEGVTQKVEQTTNGVTRQQLESLRDLLLQEFPPPGNSTPSTTATRPRY